MMMIIKKNARRPLAAGDAAAVACYEHGVGGIQSECSDKRVWAIHIGDYQVFLSRIEMERLRHELDPTKESHHGCNNVHVPR